MDKKLELLSPAKDLECGIAAINSGADAVYIGAPKFGARAAAGNSLSDIENLINYAHKYWAKVYVTLNTIIFNNELDEVESLINKLYSIGADALIIQDMGILEMNLPPIPLFASTQTNNYSLDRIKFLEQCGFKRIILARELSLKQIKDIRSKTDIDLEFFVYGALCVSFSGQCYISASICNRSANRGECSQLCRSSYSLVDEDNNTIIKDKHLLSLKDLNLYDNLEDLIDAGITSFKIEGRLKNEAYVSNVTSYFRKKLDFIISGKKYKKASSGSIIYNYEPDPHKSFNRGYTKYFLNKREDNLATLNTQKSIGEFIGKVISSTPNYIKINTSTKLNKGDGLCYFNEDNQLEGFYINRIDLNKIYTVKPIPKETIIYRNLNNQFNKLLMNKRNDRKIRIDITIQQIENDLIFNAVDEDSNNSFIKIKNNFEPAIDSLKAQDLLIKQLAKTGDSIFKADKIEIELITFPFIKISELNEIRRLLLENLLNERIKNYSREEFQITKTNHTYPLSRLNYSFNVVNNKAIEFYKNHGVQDIEPGFETSKSLENKVLMTCKYCIKNEINICPKNKSSKPFDHSKQLFLLNNNKRLKLVFDCKNCKMLIEY